MIAWVDLETTGLDASKDVVLEVACIITDDALVEVARFECVTSAAQGVDCRKLDPIVQQMHCENGLWMDSLRSDLWVNGEDDGCSADDQLHNFVLDHCTPPDAPRILGEKTGPQLAGSTISFDRAFMKAHLPVSHALLHYRNIDVTSLNEMARRFWPEVHEARPRQTDAKHRAMGDVEYSLWVARYYAGRLGPVLLDRGAAAARVNALLPDKLIAGAFSDTERDTLVTALVAAVVP